MSAFLCRRDHCSIVIPSFNPSPRQQPYSISLSCYRLRLLSGSNPQSGRGPYPRSSGNCKSITPWWTPDCARANREKRKLYTIYKQTHTSSNLILFKAAAAALSGVSTAGQGNNISATTSRLFFLTPISSVYRIVRKIFRYQEPFRSTHKRTEALNFLCPTGVDHHYDRLFTREEFQVALKLCENRTPYPEGISFQILLHVHPIASVFLLSLCNRIWVEGICLVDCYCSHFKTWKGSNFFTQP